VQRHPIDPAKISRITVETYNTVISHFSSKDVHSVMAARISVPYCVAISAVDKALTQAQFPPSRFNDPLVRQVMTRVEMIADAALNQRYPDEFPARVTIYLDGGESFTETVLLPKGDPGNAMTEAEIEAKYRDNCSQVLPAAQITQLRDAIFDLPSAPSTARLSSLLIVPTR
jgi:2-methylcitrate dehydratase PrpD